MQVIAIMGSPHKGKGYEIVQRIEAELRKKDDIEFRYIFLHEADLGICKGCFACISRGETFCPLKDDRESIEQEILKSDGVILSSPGYAWNVSGLMKNFIDRFAYSLHRPKFFNQSLMLVVNGGSGLNNVMKALSMTLGGSPKTAEMSIITTPWEANEAYANKIEMDIRLNAGKFYDSMKNKKQPYPSLGNLIWFRVFKKMASISKDRLPADYKYYSDKEYYFYETKVNPVKGFLADIIATISLRSMKKQVVFK